MKTRKNKIKFRCLAVIPARGGSKGIKNKNIFILAGKPLISYTIREAEKAKLVDKVIVSTDSPQIRKIAQALGAEAPFLRPPFLAKDITPMYPVIRHALKYLNNKGDKFDIVIILQPTSPLRSAEDIDKAILALVNSGDDSLVSVCPAKHSPYWMKIIKKGRLYPLMNSHNFTRRQDLPEVYRPSGAIYATRAKIILKDKKLLGSKVIPFIMEEDKSVDVDSLMDLRLAELFLKQRHEKRNSYR